MYFSQYRLVTSETKKLATGIHPINVIIEVVLFVPSLRVDLSEFSFRS